MERSLTKNKRINILLFVVGQIAVSLTVISFLCQYFDFNPAVILAHLVVVTSIHVAIMAIGLLSVSTKSKIINRIAPYVLSLGYGAFVVFLFFIYVLAFYGKSYNSQIFTYEIFFGYLKHLDRFIQSMSASYMLVYFVLFGVPVLTMTASLIAAKPIYYGFIEFGLSIEKHILKSRYKFVRIGARAFLPVSGLLIGIFLIRYNIVALMFRFEEPVISTLISRPYQGQFVKSDHLEQEQSIRDSYPKNIKFDKKNVIIIVVDALRSDHLHLFGYGRQTSPFLDSLHRSGNLKKIDLSFSAAAASFPGINGILRSKIWADIGYSDFSIQKLLQDQGYRINFLVSGDHTHFYGLKSFYGSNKDFTFYIDGYETKKFVVNDDRILFEGLDNIGDYNNRPSFFYFHLNSDHHAGVRQDQYSVFKPAFANKSDIENYTNRYDNGIIQADNYVKLIFEKLRDKRYLQNSIVVITADHGESLGEKGVFGHTRNVNMEQILVPILIFDTEKVELRSKHFATSLDIAPTIVDRLGLPIPKSWEGRSLLSQPEKEFTYHQMGDFYAVIHNRGNSLFKYMFNTKTRKEELYDIEKDFYECNNIIDSVSADYVSSLRAKMTVFHIDPD